MISPLEAALEAVDKSIAEHKDYPEAGVIRHRVRAMLRAYATIYHDDWEKYEVLAVEQLRLAPLRNMLTGKEGSFIAGGKIDRVVREKNGRKRVLVMDSKNLSSALDDNKIEHLLIDSQGLHYGFLEYANGVKADGFCYDVLCKTAHSPYKAGKTRKIAETLEEFEERLRGVYLENPAQYFARTSVPLLKHNLADAAHETFLWSREMEIDEQSDIHLRNPNDCFSFNRPCEFLGLCSGRSHEDDGTWIRKEKTHAELDLPEGINPLRVLTNSRLKLFRACRLRHYRKYVQGLEKVGKQPEEALFLGTVSHAGLQAYWEEIGGI